MIKTALLAILSTTMVACAGPGYYYETPSYGYVSAGIRHQQPRYVPPQNYYFSPCSPRPFTPPNPWLPGGGTGGAPYQTRNCSGRTTIIIPAGM